MHLITGWGKVLPGNLPIPFTAPHGLMWLLSVKSHSKPTNQWVFNQQRLFCLQGVRGVILNQAKIALSSLSWLRPATDKLNNFSWRQCIFKLIIVEIICLIWPRGSLSDLLQQLSMDRWGNKKIMEIEENQLTHSEYLVCLEKFGIKWPNSNHLQGLFPFLCTILNQR